MGHSLIHFAFQAGYAWVLINLVLMSFFAILFWFEQARSANRVRKTATVRRLAPVICIARR